MKKFLFCIAALFCFIIIPSCSSDESDEPGNTSTVAGTWVGDDYDKFYSNVSITFTSNGTGTASIDHHGAYTSVRRAQFTYKVKGNTVTTKGTISSANSDGETDTSDFDIKYEVRGDKLVVISGSNGWYTNVVRSYKKDW